MKILFIPADKFGCGFYRMMMPANELINQQLAEVNVSYRLDSNEMQWADLIVMQRPSSWMAMEYIRAARSYGKKIIFELDDYLPGVVPSNPGVKWWDLSLGNAGIAFEIMKTCDGVTTTTQRLANELGLWNRNVFILPNYIDESCWKGMVLSKEFEKRKKDDIIRIGWEGASGHLQDLELIRNVVKKITDDYPKVHFSIFGYAPKDILYVFDNIQSSCKHCGKENQLEVHPTVPVLEYPKKLTELAFDIGIAPAVDISFNACKSDLRFKEHSMLGIPTIASDIDAYKYSIKEGKTGFLVKTAKEWDDSLRLLIEDKKRRLEMGNEAKNWVKDLTIQKNIWRWTDVYKKVLSQR